MQAIPLNADGKAENQNGYGMRTWLLGFVPWHRGVFLLLPVFFVCRDPIRKHPDPVPGLQPKSPTYAKLACST